MTLWDLPDILISRSKGMPFGYVFPRSGTVVIDDAIGLVRGQPASGGGARRSSTTSGSVEGQLLAAREVFRLPGAARPAARPRPGLGGRASSAR